MRWSAAWELWIEEIPRLRRVLRVLEEFDVVVCSQYYTAEKLREELKSPVVIYLPPGVDTLGFAPVREPSLRPIDITNVGAIAGATHQSPVLSFSSGDSSVKWLDFFSSGHDRKQSFLWLRPRYAR